MCGAAGLLSANVETFISPDTMHWTRSGELIFMVVLGGMGTLFGPIAGAAAFWGISEFLPQLLGAWIPAGLSMLLPPEMASVAGGASAYLGEHWHLVFGPFLIFVVLFAPRGIYGMFGRQDGRDD